MAAVALALASALCFGGMAVGLRVALAREPDVLVGTIATVTVALAVALVATLAEAPARGLHAGAAWPFALAGLLQPGVGQAFATLAIRETGASRASMVFGTAPLVSVAIALVLLGEPLSAPLLAGAVLIVLGSLELARERDRPAHLRRVGLAYAFVTVILFASRDNLVRWLAKSSTAPPGVSAAAALLGGGVLLAVVARRPPSRRWLPFVPAGLAFGLSYVALFEAFYRGRVTVVSPLVATESLAGVGLSLLLLRHTELVGRRLLLGTVGIVAGGVLIGVFR
ncbi:MAG TPA: DMT family transporter [Gaiellaceae bacterium]|nr:DMT family transporter [Gaiellaceae bacterium]